MHDQDASPFLYYAALKRVKQYVDAHYDDDISIQAVAAVACLESKYFSTYFHRAVGRTFREWLVTYRLARAVERLRQDDVALSEVMRSAGFASIRSMQRAFKRELAVTPREYQRRIKNEMVRPR